MKNAMQLKAIIKNFAKEKHNISTASDAEFYVGEIVGTNIHFEISAEFYFKRWISDCGNGGT